MQVPQFIQAKAASSQKVALKSSVVFLSFNLSVEILAVIFFSASRFRVSILWLAVSESASELQPAAVKKFSPFSVSVFNK